MPENRVRDIVPIVEREMILGMKSVIPDVRIAVETTINRHWDKEGIHFPDAEYDDQGRIILPEVEFVANIPR